MKTRLFMAGMLYPMVNAVIFGTGAAAVLSIPALKPILEYAMPAVVAAAFIIAAPIAYMLAPMLRLRYWDGRRDEALSR